MRQIAIYGKGGIGKSTTVQNLAAALGQKRRRLMLIGCDPKADCTRLILGGRAKKTLLQEMRGVRDPASLRLSDILHEGCFGIRCVEAGGPEPGVGCAGRGIITAINLLEKMGGVSRRAGLRFLRCPGRRGVRRLCHADSRGKGQGDLYCSQRRDDVSLCGQ